MRPLLPRLLRRPLLPRWRPPKSRPPQRSPLLPRPGPSPARSPSAAARAAGISCISNPDQRIAIEIQADDLDANLRARVGERWEKVKGVAMNVAMDCTISFT